MSIEWTEDLATGVNEIDNQHKELFKRINNLLNACKEGKGRDETGKIIQFLDDYVITHFSAEEEYMRKYDYPGFANHKAQHLEFIENFSKLKTQIEKEGPGVHIVVTINHMVVQWLQNHIKKIDKAMGAFLKTKI